MSLSKWSRTSKNILVFRGVSFFFSRGFLLDFVFQEQLQAAMQLSLEASMAAPVPEELGKRLEVEGTENSLKTKMTLDIFHIFFSRRYIFIWCFFSIVMLVFRGVVYFSLKLWWSEDDSFPFKEGPFLFGSTFAKFQGRTFFLFGTALPGKTLAQCFFFGGGKPSFWYSGERRKEENQYKVEDDVCHGDKSKFKHRRWCVSWSNPNFKLQMISLWNIFSSDSLYCLDHHP